MLTEYSDYIVLGVGVIIAVIAWALRKEHARIEAAEDSISTLGRELSSAVNDLARNSVADVEWRKRVEENHRGLLKADEDRRMDTRKIYDKMESLKGELHSQIQRLAEKVAGK